MDKVTELPTCPWCTAVVNIHDTTRGGRPHELNGILWHNGCVGILSAGVTKTPR